MGADTIKTIKDGEMDTRECRMELTVKRCQILATHNKHMILGAPTCVPVPVMTRQFNIVLKSSEERILQDALGRYNKNLHGGDKWIYFELIITYPSRLPFKKYGKGEDRPNNGRRAFII